MAGNPFLTYGMDPRSLDWPPVLQNDRFQSPSQIMSAVANLSHGLTPRTPNPVNIHNNMAYRANSGHPIHGQHNNQKRSSKLAQLLVDASREVGHNGLSPTMPSSFEKRKKLQHFLMGICKDPSAYQLISSVGFITKFGHPLMFEAIERATGIDQMTLKRAVSLPATSSSMQSFQTQMNQNHSQGNQFVDLQHNQNPQNVGNINQFQLQGSVPSTHNGLTSLNQGNSSSYSAPSLPYHTPVPPVSYQSQAPSIPFQSQGPMLTLPRENVTDDLARSVPKDGVHTSSQSTRSWYSMPTERYEAGRVVPMNERQQNTQQIQIHSGVPASQKNESIQPKRQNTSATQYIMAGGENLNYIGKVSNETANVSPMSQLINTVTHHTSSPHRISPGRNIVSPTASMHAQGRGVKTPPSKPQVRQTISPIQPRSNSVGNNSNTSLSQASRGHELRNSENRTNSLVKNGTVRAKETTEVHDVDSKAQLRQMLSRLDSDSVNHLPDQRPQQTATQSPDIEQQSPTVTPNATVPEANDSTAMETQDPDDILDLFSMPVLNDEELIPKENEKKTRKSILENFDDMNVLSPFTSDVVSDTVDHWLSGSRRSELLDQLGIKSIKEKQQKCNNKHKSTTESAKSHSRGHDVMEEESSSSIIQPSEHIPFDEKNQSDSQRHNLKESVTQNESETYNSLGDYDPPLPMIKHRKREHRLSPVKKTDSNGDSNSIEERRHNDEGSPQTGESLFSVLDNMLNKTTHSSSSQECHNVLSVQSKNRHQSDHKDQPTDHEKRRHKSAEVSSSSNRKTENGQKDTNVSKEGMPCATDSAHTERRVTVKEKLFSTWSAAYQENERDPNKLSKLHERRKSCPEQKVLKSRTSDIKRAHTLDSSVSVEEVRSRTLTEKTTEEMSAKKCNIETVEEVKDNSHKSNHLVLQNQEFVWIHGKKLLLITIPEGQFIVMKEFLATSLSDFDSTEVYKKKTSELNINNKLLTHSCRKDVQEYLSSKNVTCPSQIDIVSLANAQKLFHLVKGIEPCDNDTCVSKECPVIPSPVLSSPLNPEKKDRSASPDSTVHGDRSSSSSTSRRLSLESRDLQQNKVSSQSLDDIEDPSHNDEEGDTSSIVSDSPDVYCDEKRVLSESLCESGGGGGDGDGDGVSGLKLRIEFDGGIAVVGKENQDDEFIRFVRIRGNKCFLYQDLFRLFGKNEVVKIVVNDSMHVKTCSAEEANYLNRYQPDLPAVDPVDSSFIQEKYARKVFAYFGESFPKLKLPINANLNDFKSPLKKSMGQSHNHPSQAKKFKRDDGTPSELVDGHACSTEKVIASEGANCMSSNTSHEKGTGRVGKKRKFEDISSGDDSCSENLIVDETVEELNEQNVEVISDLRSRQVELEDELAALKTELQETKRRRCSLEGKCQTYENDLTEMKTKLEDSIKINTDLIKRCRNEEDTVSQLKADLETKERDNQILQKERDHYKEFLERAIADNYKVADEEETITNGAN